MPLFLHLPFSDIFAKKIVVTMVRCIIHCADIHIRPYQRMSEYAEQMETFVGKCSEIASGYDRDEVRILICGDILHNKNQLSPELIVFVSYFLRRLEEIATVLVIAGNHDLIVNNMSRTDSISAIFDTADFRDCKFLDRMLGYESGCVEDDNIVWALYSIYDGFKRPDIETLDRDGKVVVGLFHGAVNGVTLNNGTVMDEGIDGSVFAGCDVVMAGDIHKRQTIRYGGVDVVYSGSLVQQTFGETVTQHGFVVWKVEEMTMDYVDLPNEYGMYDLEIRQIEDIDNDKERLINL